ncbi:MAG: hypothetical protein ACRDZW_03000, partial [Acidimicrobiales bacterium]
RGRGVRSVSWRKPGRQRRYHSSFHDPQDEGDRYLVGFDDGFLAGFADTYDGAYEDGYDEALDFYRDPLIENPFDEDCDDFSGSVILDPDDPNNLDGDGDGFGCE